MKKYKISDLPEGMIIWYKGNILGITKCTLPKKYDDYYCTKIIGNDLDWELTSKNENTKIGERTTKRDA